MFLHKERERERERPRERMDERHEGVCVGEGRWGEGKGRQGGRRREISMT